MTYVDIANLKGPKGERGLRGLPGLEGVPTDEAVAEYARTDGTELNQELTRNYVAKGEPIQNLRDFGAAGDGATDDTAAWQRFQAAPGVKAIPPGTYVVDGVAKTFLNGVIGNGEFDDASSAWDQPRGNRERHAILVHRNDIDANRTPVSPVIKTQTHTTFEVDEPQPASFKHVIGAYHEGTLDGYYNIATDTNQNFTVFGSTVRNRMAGLFGSLAILGYVEDASEAEQPLIETMGATKNGSVFLRFTRKARHENGGYMFGQEIYCMNTADETDEVPYQNNDYFSWTSGSWTSGIKVGAFSNGAPISAAMFTHGSSTGRHGFWNGLVIGSSGFKINGDSEGVAGTVGLNFASWRAGGGYADIGIKFRTANRHIYFREGAKIRSSHTRFSNDGGAAGISIEAATGSTPYLNFRQGATSAADGGPVKDVAVVDAGTSRLRLRSVGELHLEAVSGGAIYVANSARFAPATANDGKLSLGSATRRWKDIFATNGSISTSDERSKTGITSIPDAVLDAWGEVDYAQYSLLEAVADKGTSARLHTGVIAQRVVEAFERHGLDASAYGLLCLDTWEAQDEVVEEYDVELEPAVHEQVLVKPAEYRDEQHDDGTVETVEVMPAEYRDGDIITPAVTETRRTVTQPAVEAGERYGIRYEEALALEAAYQRRRSSRLEERLTRLEDTIAAMSTGN